ncbi:MAG TPA: hypothetical protein PLQ83_14855 [Thermoflexales bacterium]|nr:hypothetical protein [Thermoflexales bacterium]
MNKLFRTLAALAVALLGLGMGHPTSSRAETPPPIMSVAPGAPVLQAEPPPSTREQLREGPLAPDAVLAVIPFTTRYNRTLRGAMSFIGNTNMTCTGNGTCTNAQNGLNNSLNDTFNMVYVNSDSDSSTFNSSNATLSLPAGAQVQFARLYWGGNAVAGVGGAAPPNVALSNTIRLATPTSSYVTVTGSLLGTNRNTGQSVIYAAYADVTSLVQTAGAGAYTIANVQAGTGVRNDVGESGGLFAGWSLVVVYTDPANALRNITVWDGFGRIEPNTQGEAMIGGFVTPPTGPLGATVGVVAWEGDFGLTGDRLQVSGLDVSGPLNSASNFFNGSVSAYGAQVPRSPSYFNQLGIDVDMVDASNRFSNGQTVATLTLPTAGDNYYAGVVGLMVEVYEPELRMTKTAADINGGVLNPNDIIRWTLAMTNTGVDTATNVILRDVIPAGTTYVPGSLLVAADPSGATGSKTDPAGDDTAEYDGGGNRVVFRLGLSANGSSGGKLAPGAVARVQFDTRVGAYSPPLISDGSVLSNTGVTNYNGETLGNLYVLTATAATSITVTVPDVGVSKTDAGAIVAPGDTVIYTITAVNASVVSTMTGIVLTETLPAFTTYGGSPGWVQAGLSNQYVYSDGTLAPGGTLVVPFAVRLSENAPFTLTFLTNIVLVGDSGSNGPDNNPGNNVFTETTPVIFANLLISKIVDQAVAVAGGQLNYTVRVTNTGPAVAQNVTLRDILPPEVSYVSHTTSQGSYASGTGQWNVGSLAVNASAQINLLVNVGTAVPPGTLIVNTASVTSTTVPIPPPNAVVTTPVVGVADLSVLKDDGLSFVNVNQVITYVIVVRNSGPSDVFGARVSDTLPSGLSSAQWTCAAASGSACTQISGVGSINTLVNIAAGSRVTFTLIALVGPCDTNILVNTVQVTPPAGVTDPVTGNNTATDTDAIGPGANFTLGMRASPGAPGLGLPTANSALVYVIEAVNYGPDPATSIRVVDNLPPSVDFVSATASRGSYAPLTGLWTIGTMAVGQTAVLTIHVAVKSGLPQGTEIANIATLVTASPGNAPLGGIATNFMGQFTTVFLPVAFRADAVTVNGPCCVVP